MVRRTWGVDGDEGAESGGMSEWPVADQIGPMYDIRMQVESRRDETDSERETRSKVEEMKSKTSGRRGSDGGAPTSWRPLPATISCARRVNSQLGRNH